MFYIIIETNDYTVHSIIFRNKTK